MCQCLLKLVRSARLFLPGTAVAFLSVFISSHCFAGPPGQEETIELFSTKLIRYKVHNHFKVRGWKLGPEVYLGQAKVGGEWGLGFLVDRGQYAYGFNNERVSFIMRF